MLTACILTKLSNIIYIKYIEIHIQVSRGDLQADPITDSSHVRKMMD